MFESPASSETGPISHSVERIRKEFERWLDAVIQQGERALDAVGRRVDRQWMPAVDVVETPTEVHVDVDLAGVDPASVDVTLVGNTLTIRGPKKFLALSEGAVAHLTERPHGPFERVIPMPVAVLCDGVMAEMKNGVLRLRMVKSEKARAMKIPVRTEPSAVPPVEHMIHPL
jgi:HSP20 family protein